MDLCIKTGESEILEENIIPGFNPCFNGSMYKNTLTQVMVLIHLTVSILVLMDLCIKTAQPINYSLADPEFQSLF